jgi:hypothetical protein
MTMDDRAPRVTLIGKMFAGFAGPPPDAVKIAVYVEATERYAVEVIDAAVREALRCHEGEWAPSAPTLRRMCAVQQDRAGQGERLRRLDAGDGSPLLRDLSPEERAAKLAELRASVRRIGGGAA